MGAHKKQIEINATILSVIRHQARKLVGTAGFTESDREDIEQDLILYLLTRLPKYDPDKAAEITFVTHVIDRKARNLIRHRTCEMRDYRREAYSLNEPTESSEGANADRGALITQEDFDKGRGLDDWSTQEDWEFTQDVAATLTCLPKHLRRLCEHLMDGNITDAARAMGIPRSTACDHVKKVREYFENAGMRNYI
jgi:RNA polymerase sigma-70 factor (ECF subfamily)